MAINCMKLHRELAAAGLPVVGVCENGRIDWSRELSESEAAQAKAITAAHDPTDHIAARKAAAESAAAAVPNWSTWTAEKAEEYINANVTTLAGARVVLAAMAKLLVALRDEAWPELAGEGKE